MSVMPALRIRRLDGCECEVYVGYKRPKAKWMNQTKSRLIVRLLSIAIVPDSEVAGCGKFRDSCRQEILSHSQSESKLVSNAGQSSDFRRPPFKPGDSH